MSDDQRIEFRISRWLEEEAIGTLPERVLDSVFDETRAAPRRTRPFAGRVPQMSRSLSGLVVVGAAAIVVVVVGVALLGNGSAPGAGGSPRPGQSLTSEGSPSAAVPTGPTPSLLTSTASIATRADGGLVFAFGSLWIGDAGAVQRVDPATNTAVATIPVTSKVDRVWADDSAVYASTRAGNVRIDPATNQSSGAGPEGLVAFGSTWSVATDGTLQRLDAGGTQTGVVPVQGRVDWQPQLEAAFGSIWIASGDRHEVIRIDPAGPAMIARIAITSTDPSLLSIGQGFGSIWAQANAAGTSGVLYRIDPATNAIVATIDVGLGRAGSGYGGTIVAFSTDSVWTADSSPSITRVEPRTNTVVSVQQLAAGEMEWIAFGGGSLWVRNQVHAAVERFDAAAWVAP